MCDLRVLIGDVEGFGLRAMLKRVIDRIVVQVLLLVHVVMMLKYVSMSRN